MSISKKLDVPLSPMLCEDLTEEEQRHKEQEEKQRMTRQTISLFISTFLFSLMGMFLQLATRYGVPSTEIVFSRAAFQGIFIIPAMFLFRLSPSDADALPPTQDKDVEVDDDDEEEDMKFAAVNSFENEGTTTTTTTLPPRIIQHPFGTTKIMSNVVILRGIFGGLSFMFKFHALSTLPLGDATALMAVYPVITIFLAHIFLGEVIRPLHIVAAISSILGALLISQPRFLFGDVDGGDDVDDDSYQGYAGYISAFLENIFCSGVIVTIRKAGKVGAHTLQLLFSWMVFALSLSMLMFFVGRSSSEIVEGWIVPPAEALPSLLGTCMAAGVAHFLLNYSGKFVPATMGGLIRSSGILIAYLLEVFVFGTTPETVTIWGVFFIIMSLMIVLFQGKVDELVSFLVCQAGEYRPRMSSTFGWAKEDHRDNSNLHRQFSVA
ncbi:hypothetical protein ACHAWC_009985 [Mediolabrus comicus]